MADATTSLPVQDTASGNAPPAKAIPGLALVKAYVAVYAVLLALYIAYSFVACDLVQPPAAFLARAFPGLLLDAGASCAEVDVAALPAAFDEKRGHVRLWQDLSFDGEHGERFRILKSSRLTTHEAVALAAAIILDERKFQQHKAALDRQMLPAEAYAEHLASLEDQRGIKPFRVYKPGTFIPWPWIMTLYNLGGLFLLLAVFLRQPVRDFLDGNARTTREALARARAAEAEAQELKRRYETLVQEIEAERRQMEKTGEVELAEEHERIVQSARHEAAGMIEALKSSLDAEVASTAQRLRAEVAREAVRLAREMIEQEAQEADHAQEVDSFIRQVKEAKLP